jgi:DNA-3-methyladenine glycosylase II
MIRPADFETMILIEPRQPFSFEHTLRFILSPPALLNGRTFAPLLDYFEEGEYRRVVELGDNLILYGVSEERRGRKSYLRIQILAGPDNEKTEGPIHSLVTRQFGADLDLAPFYRLADSDAVLSKLIAHFRGMRIPQAASVYESLISAILEQQINLSFAHQVKLALIKKYGHSIEFVGRRYNAFPLPAALAIATPRELRRIQISGPKARYIIAISRAVLDGSLDLEGLRGLSPGMAHARLVEQKGVGPWTAQYVGMRALGHLDCLPGADVGLQKAIQRFYGLRKVPRENRVARIAKAWAGWRSHATFHLWLTYWLDEGQRKKLEEEIRLERRGARSPSRPRAH